MRSNTGIWLVSVLSLLYAHMYHCQRNLRRHKRDFVDMSKTLWCYRDKVQISLFAINLYGCFCGIGGSGHPQDEVDRCCFLHDCCYQFTNVTFNCDSTFQAYEYECARSRIKCKSSSVCDQMTCECDKKFAECLTAAKPVDEHVLFNRDPACNKPTDLCPPVHPSVAAIAQQLGNYVGAEKLKVSLD
ncbi:hypothetical protein XENTR_v10010811 [Xenopus tropicalis]|uniref:Phospholipase A2 n=1 Tax=Xenopus tropicalis TaxID=8364 RepID=A0A803JLZ6_XENTR|nr:hypothetical protein XENTR_v10010811 [Xenopus tropicalis]|eukprot:XP_012817552.1 PREDICTED: phospholipase A2 crotoxin basic subunit CBb-like [Xenopus tropicalis]